MIIEQIGPFWVEVMASSQEPEWYVCCYTDRYGGSIPSRLYNAGLPCHDYYPTKQAAMVAFLDKRREVAIAVASNMLGVDDEP